MAPADRQTTINHVELEALDRDGYIVLERIFDAPTVAAMLEDIRTALAAARQAATLQPGGTVSLPDMHDRAVIASAVAASTRLRDAINHLVGADHRLLRINYRAPQPGFGAQALHTDFNAPAQDGRSLVATAIIALSDFSEQNGATRVVPASHLLPRLNVPKQSGVPYAGERLICCPRGSAIVFSGHLWHSGTQNRSNSPRHALQISYARHGVGNLYYT